MKNKKKNRAKRCDSEEGYDLYAEYYDHNKNLRFLDTFERDEFFKLMRGIENQRILDIGCGTGRTVKHFKNKGNEVVCADVSTKMLQRVEEKFPGIETVKADIRELPFKDESFDVVVALFVIVHLNELKEAFSEVFRVLKPGGVFILSNINQRKAPKLDVGGRKEVVIKSHYHMPRHVLEALDNEFFVINKEIFVGEGKNWINQLIKAIKPDQ